MDMHQDTGIHTPWGLDIEFQEPSTLLVKLSGSCCLQSRMPHTYDIITALYNHPEVTELSFNTDALTEYDSGMVIWLLKLEKLCESRDIIFNKLTLPLGLQHLVHLAKVVPPHGFVHVPEDKTLFGRTGALTVRLWHRGWELIDLIGASVRGSVRVFTGRSIFLKRDILLQIQDNGPDAFAIVIVISFLVGITLALVGAVQLAKFGSEIFIADMEVVGILREMGALMVGIIMAGRAASAYAAEIGSMKSDDEVDALHALAISAIDFLVMPRIIATIIAMPLLVIFADVIGNLAGLFFSSFFLDITYLEYMTQAREAFLLGDFFIGIGKGLVFGYVIAIAGCLRGLQCGRSAAAVGSAATSAVVLSIVLVMLSNTAIDIMLYALRI